jgi:hypothetical protein
MSESVCEQTIQRYEDDRDYGIEESEWGDYVLYDDHLKVVQDMKVEILKLKDDIAIAREDAYDKGWEEGYANGSKHD